MLDGISLPVEEALLFISEIYYPKLKDQHDMILFEVREGIVTSGAGYIISEANLGVCCKILAKNYLKVLYGVSSKNAETTSSKIVKKMEVEGLLLRSSYKDVEPILKDGKQIKKEIISQLCYVNKCIFGAEKREDGFIKVNGTDIKLLKNYVPIEYAAIVLARYELKLSQKISKGKKPDKASHIEVTNYIHGLTIELKNKLMSNGANFPLEIKHLEEINHFLMGIIFFHDHEMLYDQYRFFLSPFYNEIMSLIGLEVGVSHVPDAA
tara:strand:+ start:631 stop:1428 length:798 start_codon:yes stop_codon:yes gene_type:complete